MRLPAVLLLLAALACPRVARAEPAPPVAPGAPASAPHALYPLWEGTGRLLGHRRLYLGTSQLALGLLGTVEVGVRPLSFLFRAPNAHVRVRLLERERLGLVAQAGVLVLLPGASEAFSSSNFVSRLDNRHVHLTVVPLSLAASWQAAPWLHVHATGTVMPLLNSGAYRNRAVAGGSLVVEALALERHSLFAHLAEVGFFAHDFSLVGLSYRYRRGVFEGRLGYFYRLTPDGVQAAPLLALGGYL